jgi:hypothetical protein
VCVCVCVCVRERERDEHGGVVTEGMMHNGGRDRAMVNAAREQSVSLATELFDKPSRCAARH